MTSEMIVTFPGRKRVDTQIGEHVIRTDQPASTAARTRRRRRSTCSSQRLAPARASTSSGSARSASSPTEGIQIRQRNHFDPETRVLQRVELDIEVPPSFPRSTATRSSASPISAR